MAHALALRPDELPLQVRQAQPGDQLSWQVAVTRPFGEF